MARYVKSPDTIRVTIEKCNSPIENNTLWKINDIEKTIALINGKNPKISIKKITKRVS